MVYSTIEIAGVFQKYCGALYSVKQKAQQKTEIKRTEKTK